MNSILIKDQKSIEGDRPAHLSNGLPSMLMICSDITPMYIPLLFNSFQIIEIDKKDQSGRVILFDYGTLTVKLHFKRLD